MSKETLDVIGWGMWGAVGVMMIMFGVAWLFAGRLASPARRAVGLVAAHNLVEGVGLVLWSLQAELPYQASTTLSGVLVIVAWVLMWRAAAELAGLPDSRREQAVLLVVSIVPVLMLSGSPANLVAHLAVCYLSNAWVGLRAGWQVARKLYIGSAVGMAVGTLVFAWGMALPLAVHALRGLFLPERADAGVSLTAQPVLAAIALVCAFGVNVLVANVVFGRVVRELNRLTERDPLTGMASIGVVERALAYECRRQQQRREPLAVLSLAVDHLPALRAAHGASVADLVVAEAVLQFRLLLRPGDVLGHEGDGRFVAVLPGADGRVAEVIARSAVRVLANDAGLHPEPGHQVTVSAGVALLRPGQDPQALLALARARRDAASAAGGSGVNAGPPAGRHDPVAPLAGAELS